MDKDKHASQHPSIPVSESSSILAPQPASLLASHQPLRWYALYTRPRHEKTVASHLESRRVEVFLPLREVLSRWKDRRKLVHLPLFPGYVFVRTVLARKHEIVSVPGSVRLVGFDGAPAPIPDEQVEAVRRLCETRLACDPYPYLTEGRRVEVVRGLLAGCRGIIVRKKGKFRLVLSVDVLRQSVSVEIDSADVRPDNW